MSLITLGPLANSIHGSIGGTNFYKHGPWQVVRKKGQPKQATSYLRGKAQACHSEALSKAKLNYRSTTKTRIDKEACEISLTKYGRSYKVSGFQHLVNKYFIGLFYFGSIPVILGDRPGRIPPLVMTVDIWNLPNYIVINFEDPPVVTPTLCFDWAYPISWENAPKPSKFPYHDMKLIGAAGQWRIAQGSRPRITGRTCLWWRARLITGFGDYSVQWSGFVTKFNWQ